VTGTKKYETVETHRRQCVCGREPLDLILSRCSRASSNGSLTFLWQHLGITPFNGFLRCPCRQTWRYIGCTREYDSGM